MSEEQIVTPIPVVEPEFKSTLTPEQLAVAKAEIGGRSYSARHPELGKMISCGICHLRHRVAKKCEQRFTNVAGDFEYFKEEKNEKTGEVKIVPAFRTAMDAAIDAVGKPTKRSVIGAAAFARKRLKPHHSKIKLLFIERVREVVLEWEGKLQANLDRNHSGEEHADLREKIEGTYKSEFSKYLHRARIVAARRIRRSREERDRILRNITKRSRRINRESV